jgi:periplasmic protein TonB
MSAAAETRPGGRAAMALRWALCFGLVLSVHLGVALLLLRHGFQSDHQSAGAPPDAVMLDLAPAATTPSPGPASEPPPEPPPPAPAPIPRPEPPPLVSAPAPTPIPPPQTSVPDLPEPPPPAPPPPRPVVRPTERSVAHAVPPRPVPRQETVREPQPGQTSAPAAAASGPAVPAPPSPGAVAGWRSALIQRLQQAKRYPEAARAHNEQGVATISFTMDRNGHVLSVRLVHGSGSDALDQEAVAMIHRADPLPALPAGIEANTLSLTVPVTFSLQ